MSDARGGSGRNTDRSGPGGTPVSRPPKNQGSGGGHAASAGPDQGPRPPSWRVLITGLLTALVRPTIMVTTYMAAQHAVVARHLPRGVTSSSPLTPSVQKHVSLKIHRYSDQTVPQDAANPTEVYGVVYVVAGAALVTIATYGRLMWWRGSERRCPPVSPEPEGGAAALPPA